MISEQDKQAILNGAYAVTRDGRKFKYVGRTKCVCSDDLNLNLFICLNANGLIVDVYYLNDKFLYNLCDESDNDIVGLWVDKP